MVLRGIYVDLTVEAAIRAKPPYWVEGRRIGKDLRVVVDVIGVDKNQAVGWHHIVADLNRT